MSKHICIVIPFYNEEGRFPESEFLEYYRNSSNSFCLVNDGSKDSTLSMLERIAEGRDRIAVINNCPNQGKAEALRRGINYALSTRRYDYLAYIDADFSAAPSEIDRLSEHLTENSLIMGSRFKCLGNNIQRKVWRHYFGRVFATFASLILNMPVYDTQCGAKIMTAEFARIAFTERFLTRWLFDIEMLFRIGNANPANISEIKEVPLAQWIDKGKSKIRLTDVLKIPFQMIKLFFYYN